MKILLVGYGHLGKWHAEKLLSLYGENFIGIVEVDESKHSMISEKFKKQKVVTSLNKIIDEVDAVVIATPTSFHFELVKQTLNSNKHCFVEKPMTSTLSQSEEIGELVSRKNIVFQVGHSERFHGFWKDVLKNEEFNSVKVAKFNRLAPYKGRGDDVDIIFDLMIHDYDLLNMLGFGNPVSIEAWGESCHTKMIDYCTSKITYENKIVFVTASRSSIEEKRSAEFVFDNGVLEIDLMSSTIRRSCVDKENEEFQYEKRDHLLEEHKLFKKSIEDGSNNEINYGVGHFSMKMMDLTLKSIRERKVVHWS